MINDLHLQAGFEQQLGEVEFLEHNPQKIPRMELTGIEHPSF
jgi:hypothetical protein